MYDTIIRGGTVVDGSGSSARTADVCVLDGRIVAIGKIDEPARRTIDADGALVAPGWVDGHTHYDGQVTWDGQLEGSASNGVTTVVMGNCGVGFAPVPPDGVKSLIDLMEGVEDIPGTALYEGMPWGAWETFPEYLSFLDKRQWSADVCAQIAHGALRHYVMGDRAVSREAATADDLERMMKITEEAVRAGAIGFSTNRIIAHRSMSGHCVPGTFAAEEELAAIAKGMRAGGGAVLQAIPSGAIGQAPGLEPEHSSSVSEIGLFGRISRDNNLRVVLSAFQINEAPELWREMFAEVSKENSLGAQLSPMVSPRALSMLTTLDGYHAFMRRPTYLKLSGLPLAERVSQLRRADIKKSILSESDVPPERPGSVEATAPIVFGHHALPLLFRMRDPIDYEPKLEDSLYAQAVRQGRDPIEFLYDFLLEDEGAAVGINLSLNYVNGNLNACREMLLDENSVTGLSDAGAHVNFICDLSLPTFNLTHWVRDRTRGERLPIELVVAKCTSAPARLFGLSDRGLLQVGKRADINIIDLANLKIEVPTLHRDLPAGSSRFLQPSSGYLATLVNGVQTRERDQDTGARPGRVARPIRESSIPA